MSWGSSFDGVSLRKITEYKPLEGNTITKDDLAGGPVLSGVAINAIWQNNQAIARSKADPTTILSCEPNDPIPDSLDGERLQPKTPWPSVDQIKNKFERTNKVPTHDPYTNPNAQIYFSCNCGAILDPGTKSFASLCKSAGDSGWKIRFGETHYNAYCVECGKDVE